MSIINNLIIKKHLVRYNFKIGEQNMIKKKLLLNKKFIAASLIIYTILLIYLMFLGFGRLQLRATHRIYRFQMTPTGIPLWFPKHLEFYSLRLWILSLGNLLLFVPFGVLIPRIFNLKYPRFILGFLISITSLEILQMVTYLGSFDINDIIINSIGATIGFLSYKIGNKAKSLPRKIIITVLWVIIFTVIMIVLAETFN